MPDQTPRPDKTPPLDQAPSTESEELLRMASVAAHQLKSPLARVQQMLSTVLGGFVGPLNTQQRGLLERAAKSCGQGIEMVSDMVRIRSLGEIEADQLGPVDLLSVFRGALERGAEVAREAGVSLESELALRRSEAWVRADAVALAEVVHELLGNALKYTPQSGQVRARLSWAATAPDAASPPADARAVPTSHTGFYLLEIIDTGIGIPAADYARIFEEFYRAPNAKQINREGSGLGLSFVLRVARRLGGTLHLEPAQSGGVHATLAVPAAEPSDWAAVQPAPRYSQRVVIIGGVVAGAKAAAKMARLDPRIHITVVERGRFLAYAGCGLPFYISGAVPNQQALKSTPLGASRDLTLFHNLHNTQTLDATEALSVDPQARRVYVRNLIDGEEASLPYDHLLLACGATPRIPNIPGVDLPGVFTLQGVKDAEAIRAAMKQQSIKEVVIVGAGLLGVEITEALVLRGARITLVEAQTQILGIVSESLAAQVHRHLSANGVKLLTGVSVCAIEGVGHAQEVRLSDGRRLNCDYVILAAGVRPNSDLAQAAGLTCSPTGGIVVDTRMRTSDPFIYAAGDCVANHHRLREGEAFYPMGSTALKQGRVAAINICGGDERFEGVLGSIALKVFGLTIARTGLSRAQATLAGFDAVSVIVSGPDQEHYLPTARPILLNLIADRPSQRLLGAQAVGLGEVTRRIDVVAVAISAGMTLEAFTQLDLPYAPPLAQGVDVVLSAGYVLRNKIEGRFPGMRASKVKADHTALILDVRAPDEYELRKIPGSVHIPLGALRGRLDELPRQRPIVLVCSIGLRGYEAALILAEHGFTQVSVLDGGLAAWPYALEEI
ncbi:FAD-dependent oxidoreductase [Myxococcota bacterium]|nr:FAD-dependent oxidoreductase [Myxococcota bacterium]